MFTRFAEKIFYPSRYTGCIYDYAHSFIGVDFKTNPMHCTCLLYINC